MPAADVKDNEKTTMRDKPLVMSGLYNMHALY